LSFRFPDRKGIETSCSPEEHILTSPCPSASPIGRGLKLGLADRDPLAVHDVLPLPRSEGD